MSNTNIQTIEGTEYKVTLNVSGVENLTDYRVEGSCKAIGPCAHGIKPFRVTEARGTTIDMFIPTLASGSYLYQVFITRISTNQEFMLIEGRIDVSNKIKANEDTTIAPTGTIADVTLNADTVEVSLKIEKGLKGDKGDKGEQGFSAYEVATHHGYKGTVEEWVSEFEGAQSAAAAAKSSEAMAEYYYKGSQTNYNNSVTEALNAEQAANSANSAATVAASSATEAMNYSNESKEYSIQSANSATAAATNANNAKSSATEAMNYSNECKEYYTQSAQSATSAANSATAAANSATSAATNASKLGDAALKSSNNTFSGTNTFNNITKVTVAPDSLTSVVNQEASRLLDFVQQASIGTVESTLTKITGTGTQQEFTNQIRYICPKGNEVSLWSGSFHPYFTGTYIQLSAIWVPFYTDMNTRTSGNYTCKFRFIASFCANVGGGTDMGEINNKLIKQVSDISKPFMNFNNLKTIYHCAAVEFFCEIINKKYRWTLYAPILGSTTGMTEQIKVITFETPSQGGNYSDENGFLFVASGSSKAKIYYRDFIGGSYRWLFCGEIDFMSTMFAHGNYTREFYYAGSGGDNTISMYMPKQITFLPFWMNNGNFDNSQQILQAYTPTDRTETIITIDEYNALQV